MHTLKEFTLPLCYCLISAAGGWALEHHSMATQIKTPMMNSLQSAPRAAHEIGVTRSSSRSHEKVELTAA